jgi:hypothetical protein
MDNRRTCIECGRRRQCREWFDGRQLCRTCFRWYLYNAAKLFTVLLVYSIRSGAFQQEAKRLSSLLQQAMEGTENETQERIIVLDLDSGDSDRAG